MAPVDESGTQHDALRVRAAAAVTRLRAASVGWPKGLQGDVDVVIGALNADETPPGAETGRVLLMLLMAEPTVSASGPACSDRAAPSSGRDGVRGWRAPVPEPAAAPPVGPDEPGSAAPSGKRPGAFKQRDLESAPTVRVIFGRVGTVRTARDGRRIWEER